MTTEHDHSDNISTVTTEHEPRDVTTEHRDHNVDPAATLAHPW